MVFIATVPQGGQTSNRKLLPVSHDKSCRFDFFASSRSSDARTLHMIPRDLLCTAISAQKATPCAGRRLAGLRHDGRGGGHHDGHVRGLPQDPVRRYRVLAWVVPISVRFLFIHIALYR